MTSKEALENIRDYHNETVIDNYCTYTENMFEKELDIIEKDLEILEMFKKRMSIEVAYYNGDKRFGTYKYIEYNGAPLDIETKEEFDKIKEWLLK